MKSLVLTLLVFLVCCASPMMGSICPTTGSTNSDCGFILTIGPGGTLTGALVLVSGNPAAPYDGSDDALVGVVNNSGGVFTGSLSLSGSGNGGGIFAFEGDGICTYISCSWSHPTGYEGPLNTFASINSNGTAGNVVITGLGAGATTYFSLEGSPASIQSGGGLGSVPEPSSLMLMASGLAGMAGVIRRKLLR